MTKSWWQYIDYDFPNEKTITVFEVEQNLFTGLLDSKGNRIYKTKQPLGFHKAKPK